MHQLSRSIVGLAIESQAVIGIRLLGLTTGRTDKREARRMVAEKAKALAAAQFTAAVKVMAGRGHEVLDDSITSYRKVVRRNLRRLSR